MNLELVQKLRQLIRDSTILNPGEKQEWDALLELMNDMQMRELEKNSCAGAQSFKLYKAGSKAFAAS